MTVWKEDMDLFSVVPKSRTRPNGQNLKQINTNSKLKEVPIRECY